MCAEKEEKRSFWSILNSPFVLWVLSAAIISLGTQIWTSQQHATEKRRADRIREARIRLEMTDRLTTGAGDLVEFDVKDDFKDPKRLRQVLHRYGFFEPQRPLGGFPEFDRRSLQSVLWELRELRPDLEPQILKAQAKLSTVRILLDIETPDVERSEYATRMAYEYLNASLEHLWPILDTPRLDALNNQSTAEWKALDAKVKAAMVESTK
jgi:hypothetical protein